MSSPSSNGSRLQPPAGVALPEGLMMMPAAPDGEITLKEIWMALQRRRRWFVLGFGVTLAITGALTLWQRLYRPTYEGSFTLLVSDPLSEDRQSGGPSNQLSELALVNPGSVDLPNLIEVLTSPMLLQPLASSQGLPAGALAGRVTARSVQRDADGVLKVSLQWRNPEQGEQLLKALSRSYLAYSLRQRQEKLSQGLKFLDEQAPGLQQRVSQIQQELANFRRANALLIPEDRAKQIELERADLEARERQLQQGQAQLVGLQASVRRGQLFSPQFQGASGGSGGGLKPATGADLSGALASGAFSQLLADLTDVEKQLAEASGTFRSSSPLVQSLTAQRNKLRPLLQRRQLDAVASALQENAAQQAEVQRQLAQLERAFRVVGPELVKQYDALNQRLEIARDNLSNYLKARESFRLEVAQKTLPWQVISPPSFGQSPVKPNLSRNLMLGLLLGAMAGAGAALLRDRLDHVFHSPRDVEQGIDQPLLGSIPFLPLEPLQSVQGLWEQLDDQQLFSLRESLRNLYRSLQLVRAGGNLRMLALTSTGSGEGKTTSVALLGQALADLGLKVLLVDGDLREMQLHQRFAADGARGWSELFTEHPPELEALIQWPEANLGLLPVGRRPPDAAKLLSSVRCGEVIQQLRALPQFDLVLFDTPPALDLVDPLLLGDHLDGLLFVVSLGRIDRNLPYQALKRIQASNTDLLGVIANQTQPVTNLNGYGYGYGSGYGYVPRPTTPNPWKHFDTQYPKLKQLRERAEAGFRWLDQRL